MTPPGLYSVDCLDCLLIVWISLRYIVMSDITIVTARRRRGMLRGRLTRIEREVVNLEKKVYFMDEDQRKIERLIDQIKDNDTDFEQRHLDVLNFVSEDDEDTLQREEAIFDEHVDRVTELIERLEHLKLPDKTTASSTVTTAPDCSSTLGKRLKHTEQEKETVTDMHSPPAGTEDHHTPI